MFGDESCAFWSILVRLQQAEALSSDSTLLVAVGNSGKILPWVLLVAGDFRGRRDTEVMGAGWDGEDELLILCSNITEIGIIC